ncbi:MAG: hypothetical protein A2538_02805 [Candidatus Magasanikbacteria bacterium RIFOXYD2_FULL_41_14]|uniref:pyruvate kinase n=1 Tax=Candidatus Magasanikbacteria bacterium RIFOXYD2_FULL_41_14 TaxID=1798709 RepID=A0A1F6PC92_9BACT|nr:MAG: hypothetical protein A2538_02805 [Candidatus Magasanikbacteria bacterium RIFOXYD2_FULL_41_14]
MLIIASLGVNSLSEDKIKKIILAGADVLRYNFAYRTLEENRTNIKNSQEIIYSLNADTKILIDLPALKPRLGDFETKSFAVQENEEFLFKSASHTMDCNEFVPVNVARLGEIVKLNQTITIGDGEIAIQIINIIDQDTVKAKILNTGTIFFKKPFNIFGFQYLDEKHILNFYQKTVPLALDTRPNYIAIPFFNLKINEALKAMIPNKEHIKIIIKITKKITSEELDTICDDNNYSMILWERGDVGVSVPFEQMGILQKNIISLIKKKQKKIIISTQILDSTINSYIPNRSEISDLTNMVMAGVDGIMLCHETAFGRRPAYTIANARKIIKETEKHMTILHKI